MDSSMRLLIPFASSEIPGAKSIANVTNHCDHSTNLCWKSACNQFFIDIDAYYRLDHIAVLVDVLITTFSHCDYNWTRSFFFFSSRRRHTRYWRDWSSDVCSSD